MVISPIEGELPDFLQLCHSFIILMTFNCRWREDLMEHVYLTENIPLSSSNHSFESCGTLEAISFATLFRKHGLETGSSGQERYTLKTYPQSHISAAG